MNGGNPPVAGRASTGWLAGLAAFAMLVAAQLSALGGEPPELPPVTLSDQGGSVWLDNGVVGLEIQKDNGYLLSLHYRGKSLLAEAGYLDWQSGGDNHLHNARFRVVTNPAANGGNLAEVSVEQKPDLRRSPFAVEQHFLLRRGESGCHCFVVFRHSPDGPAGQLDQSRWVLRLKDNLFDFINVDEPRRRVMPPSDTPVRILGPKESMMFTAGPFRGEITDKYQWFVDAGDHFVHGWSGTQSQLGAWILQGSNEAQNGGPTKQHNTAHFGRLLFKVLTCGHYGASGIKVAAGEDWSKLYGPWMLYVNFGGSPDALWADAQNMAAKERATWPLPWVRHPLYPLEPERGTVKGRIVLQDLQDSSLTMNGAWVGLAAPSPDWQQQSKGYQFWVHAAADGTFKIPQVRAGNYTLYAFVRGVLEEFRHDGVTVRAGGTTELGNLSWQAQRHGRMLWQIGTPDRTAKEFRHGDDFRQWGLWQQYPVEFPRDVDFIIGQSRERTDWNYAQVNVQKDGQWTGTTWKVEFDLPPGPVSGTATLRLALASAQNAKLAIRVNGTVIDRYLTGADNAMIRAGIHGQYHLRDIPFNAAGLKPGRNVLTLSQEAGGNMQKSVMYDCLRLELDGQRDFDPVQDKPQMDGGRSSEAALTVPRAEGND